MKSFTRDLDTIKSECRDTQLLASQICGETTRQIVELSLTFDSCSFRWWGQELRLQTWHCIWKWAQSCQGQNFLAEYEGRIDLESCMLSCPYFSVRSSYCRYRPLDCTRLFQVVQMQEWSVMPRTWRGFHGEGCLMLPCCDSPRYFLCMSDCLRSLEDEEDAKVIEFYLQNTLI